jgi:hypothetical protein
MKLDYASNKPQDNNEEVDHIIFEIGGTDQQGWIEIQGKMITRIARVNFSTSSTK